MRPGNLGPEKWVETRLWFSRFDPGTYDRLLLSLVKPVVENLEDSGSIKSFHFLFERDPHFLLRIQPNAESLIGEVKNQVKEQLKGIGGFLVAKPEEELFAAYPGESVDFGEEGWEITKKIFEVGSRMAIAKADPLFKKGRMFDEGKLLHCFLNSLGYSKFNARIDGEIVNLEALFHLDTFISRILIVRNKKTVDSEIESEIGGLTHRRLENWKGQQMEII